MQILNIIFTIVAIIANAAVTYFAVTAWFELRRMRRDITDVKRSMAITTFCTMGEHVRSNFDELAKIKATFRRLVEDEQYEEADRLAVAIRKMERHAEEALRHFRDLCGNDACEVFVTEEKNEKEKEQD